MTKVTTTEDITNHRGEILAPKGTDVEVASDEKDYLIVNNDGKSFPVFENEYKEK